MMLVISIASWAQGQPEAPPPPGPAHDVFFISRGASTGFGPGMGMPMGNWWKNSDVIQQLQLTDTQRQQLEKAFVQHRLRLVDERGAVEKNEIKLQELMDMDQPPESQVMSQVDQLQAARGQLEKEFTSMTLDFRRIISPEQWRKLQTISQKERRVFFQRGPGMPGPPPMPPDAPRP
jgi:Spy/CpxP family protein refolding chaperone